MKIRIIGVPMDLGQKRRGVDMGPSAIRYAELSQQLKKLGHQVSDSGNITIPGHCRLENTQLSSRLPCIRSACEVAYKQGVEAIKSGEFPLFLGGDHSASIGTIGGVSEPKELGVLWVDAHADFNTPATSPSQNVHGMALAALVGNGPPELTEIGRIGEKINPKNVVIIGLREVDGKEQEMLREWGITLFTMRDIDEQGMGEVSKKALNHLKHLSALHLSFDMDVLDPGDAPGVGTPVHGGITYREAQLLMELLFEDGRICSADFMELNPILDVANRTGKAAVSLATSLLGKTIL